jgi:hypothetical protein
VADVTAYENVLDALRTTGLKVTESPNGARSQCPSHGSRGLTLAVRENPRNPDGPLHVTCFAGCETEAVLAELGLGLRDLYEPKTTVRGGEQFIRRTPRPKPSPWDALGDPDHFASRCLQQEALEASSEYHQHLADLAEWAKPRPGDFSGRGVA